MDNSARVSPLRERPVTDNLDLRLDLLEPICLNNHRPITTVKYSVQRHTGKDGVMDPSLTLRDLQQAKDQQAKATEATLPKIHERGEAAKQHYADLKAQAGKEAAEVKMRQDRTKEYIRRVTARNARLRKGALVLEGVRLLGADGSPARGAAGSDTCEVFLHPGSPPLAGGATARLGAQHNDDASAGPIELVFTIYDQSPSSSSDAAASPSTSNEPSTLLSVAGQQQQRRQGSFTSSVPPSASSLARQRLLNHSSGGSSSSAAATGHATAMATAPLPLPPSPEKVTLPPAAPAAIAPSSASTPAEAPLQPVPRVVRVSRSHPTPVDVPAAASSSNGSPPPAGRQAPRVLSMDKRQLELLAGRIHAVGLKLPALCTCAAADPFDPNYVAKCCHNCPLYNQPEAYEQLLGHMLLHYGLL